MGKITISEQTAPATPPSGKGVIYPDSADGLLKYKDDGGTVYDLTAGGGGGNVATDTIWDSKGDLAGGTGANTAARLAVGTNGQVLTADSAEVTGLKWSTVSGTGDVVGPASATDNAIVRFDSTTGKLIQNSAVTIADTSGNIAGAGTISSAEITSSSLTASRLLVSGSSKEIQSTSVTTTEAGYLSGVTSAIQTQMNLKAPLASPTFSGTIGTALTASRVVKTDGSSNLTTGTVNLASASEVSGNLPVTNLNSGTSASGTTFWRGDGTWATPAGGGSSPLTTKGDVYTYSTVDARLPVGTNGQVLTSDSAEVTGLKWTTVSGTGDVSSNTASSVDSEIALFSSTTGKLIKRATGTGVAHVTSGVLSASNVVLTSEVTGVLPVANGGTNASAALNNNRVMVSSSGTITEATAITANRAIVSNASGIPVHATTTDTEIGYVNGVTSAIQTQINAKQASDATLTALAAYNTNGVICQTAADTFSGRTITGGVGTTVTNGDGVAGNPTITASTNAIISSIGITIDGGGSAITTGVKGYIEVPYACTIVRATTLADVSGSIVIDVWKDTYANYPPTVADTITASAKPTISSATKAQDSTLTGWTTSVSAGDIIGFNVDSCTTITRAHLILKVNRT